MIKKILKSHKCKSVIENKVAINLQYTGEKYEWLLLNSPYSPVYDVYYSEIVCKVHYCPFCGRKLK